MNQVRRWTPDSEGVMCEDSRDMLFATVGRDSYVLAYDYDVLKADYAALERKNDEEVAEYDRLNEKYEELRRDREIVAADRDRLKAEREELANELVLTRGCMHTNAGLLLETRRERVKLKNELDELVAELHRIMDEYATGYSAWDWYGRIRNILAVDFTKEKP